MTPITAVVVDPQYAADRDLLVMCAVLIVCFLVGFLIARFA